LVFILVDNQTFLINTYSGGMTAHSRFNKEKENMATLSQMGIPGAGFGILHPKQKYRWRVTFVGFARLVSGASSRELTRQATTVTRPNLSFEEIQMHRYNSIAYAAGKHTWDPISLTIEDDITGLASYAVQGQLETQQRLIGADLPGQWLNAAATGSDYKFGTILEMLDGNEGVVESWKVEGCWLQSVDYGDLDYSASDANTITMQIRYDHARQDLTGQGYGTALAGNLN
jgi:hypothetical protein